MENKKRIVAFASGSGTNFININENITNGKVVLLISNNPECGAIDYARKNGVDYQVINDFRYPKDKNKEYETVLNDYQPDVILLAGFMKKIPNNIIQLYKNKIMNIHPSLLPAQYSIGGIRETVSMWSKGSCCPSTNGMMNHDYLKLSVTIRPPFQYASSKALAARTRFTGGVSATGKPASGKSISCQSLGPAWSGGP